MQATRKNNVNLYEYYGISAITLDIDNATCDVNVIGEQKPINKDVIKPVSYTHLAHPINSNTRDMIQTIILNKYETTLLENEAAEEGMA